MIKATIVIGVVAAAWWANRAYTRAMEQVKQRGLR